MVNNLSINDFIEIIENTKFYSDNGSDFIIKCGFLNKFHLNDFDFSLRFKNTCNFLNLEYLTDILNTDSSIFLNNINCGRTTIYQVRREIKDYIRKFARDNNFYNLQSLILKLNGIDEDNPSEINWSVQDAIPNIYPFFKKVLHFSVVLLSDFPENKLSYSINEIDFGVRFSHYLKAHPEIKTVNDLLNTDINSIISICNIGRKSILEARKTLYDFLTAPENHLSDDNIPLDEIILKRIEKEFPEIKYYEIFLLKYGYNEKKISTLEEIGKKYHLTRERIRQILERCGNKIFKKKSIMKEFLNEIEKRSAVSNINTYISELIDKKGIFKNNHIFLQHLIKSTLIQDKRFKVVNDYVYLKDNICIISETFENINNVIAKHITKTRMPMSLTQILEEIKTTEIIPYSEINFYINFETLKYISITYKNIFIVDNLIYNDILYNLYFGKLISDIVYSAMLYLNEPIHFESLTKFIRENNKSKKKICEVYVVGILSPNSAT